MRPFGAVFVSDLEHVDCDANTLVDALDQPARGNQVFAEWSDGQHLLTTDVRATLIWLVKSKLGVRHMRKIILTLTLMLSGVLFGTNAGAVLVSTNGSISSAGGAAAIIAAPADARDDAAFNNAIQAFNERIGVLLAANLAVDGDTIAAGTRVDSHMIFLNSGPGNNNTLIEHGANGNQNAASFTFNGAILGVMSNSNGSLETNSTPILGSLTTNYPGSPFSARGMEGNPLDGLLNNDWYSFTGNTIQLGMRVTEPGDWIRVVTVSAVPIPAALPLMFGGLGLLGLAGWRKKRKLSA